MIWIGIVCVATPCVFPLSGYGDFTKWMGLGLRMSKGVPCSSFIYSITLQLGTGKRPSDFHCWAVLLKQLDLVQVDIEGSLS